MKTITHAQLVEESPFSIRVLDQDGDAFKVAIVKDGACGQRVYMAESRQVNKSLQQIAIIGIQEVTAFGIGDFARLVRTDVGMPEPHPEFIDEPFVEEVVPLMGGFGSGIEEASAPRPTLFDIVKRRFGTTPTQRIAPPPSPVIDPVELSDDGLRFVGCLLEANEVAKQFNDLTGIRMTPDGIRRIATTLFIQEVRDATS